MDNYMEQSKVKIELTLAEFKHLFEITTFIATSEEDERLRLKLLHSLTKEQRNYLIKKLLDE